MTGANAQCGNTALQKRAIPKAEDMATGVDAGLVEYFQAYRTLPIL